MYSPKSGLVQLKNSTDQLDQNPRESLGSVVRDGSMLLTLALNAASGNYQKICKSYSFGNQWVTNGMKLALKQRAEQKFKSKTDLIVS